jgi:hypothetical protein
MVEDSKEVVNSENRAERARLAPSAIPSLIFRRKQKSDTGLAPGAA